MKQIKKRHLLALCALSFLATIHVETKSMDNPSHAAIMAELDKEIENMLESSFDILAEIGNRIGELATLIAQGTFKSLANRKDTIEVLTEDRKVIDSISRNRTSIVATKDPNFHTQCAYALLQIANALMLHLESGLNTNFQSIESFEAIHEKMLQKTRQRNITPEFVSNQIEKTKKQLAVLRNSTDNAGLTWYNKLARGIDRRIITPANKYNIPTITYYTAGASFLVGYALCKWGHNLKSAASDPDKTDFNPTYLDRLIIKLQDTFPLLERDQLHQGQYYPVGKKGKNDLEAGPTTGIIGMAEFAFSEFMLGHAPIATYGGGMLLTSLAATWSMSIKPALEQKRDMLWNFLRGGDYQNKNLSGLYSIDPKVNFDNLVGAGEATEVFQSIIEFLRNPEQYTRAKAAPEQGILLTGEPRTGKSFSFKCLCGEITRMQERLGETNKFKYYSFDAPTINAYGIKEVLKFARENAPVVIFIDEIDLLNLTRIGNNPLLSEFLQEFERSMNTDPSKVVIILAASNKPEHLDDALRKNGRFGKEIRFEVPAKKYRIEFITKELSNMALDMEQFDINALAEKTHGKTFEDLSAVIRHAMRLAWFRQEPLTQELLEHSIDTELHHIITMNRKDLPDKELRILASHFAGRAIATLLLDTHAQLDKVTIHARMADIYVQGVWEDFGKKDEKDKQAKIEYGAILTKQTDDTINVRKKEHIINEVKSLLAGFMAEEILLGSCGFTCHSKNHELAYKLLEQTVFGGLNPEKLAKQIKMKLSQEVYDLLRQCETEVTQLLLEHHDALIALADELMVNQIMNDKQVQAVVDKVEKKIDEPAEQITAQELLTSEKTTDNSDQLSTSDDIVIDEIK